MYVPQGPVPIAREDGVYSETDIRQDTCPQEGRQKEVARTYREEH